MTWTDWLTFWKEDDKANQDKEENSSGLSDATQRAVQTIVSKIDELSSNLQDRIANSEDRIDDLEEQIDEVDQDIDYQPDVTEDDFEALKARVDELAETIDGFTEVYEAMSSQYNPLINEQASEQQVQQQPLTGQDDEAVSKNHTERSGRDEKPLDATPETQADTQPMTQTEGQKQSGRDQLAHKPGEQGTKETTKTPNKGSEKQRNDERNITIKDSLTDETEEFTLGEEPSRSEEERRQQELQRTTEDDVEPRSKEDSVEPVLNKGHVEQTQEPSFGPEHASKHIDNPKLDTSEPRAQDTTEPVVTEQRQQPAQEPVQRDTASQSTPRSGKDQQNHSANKPSDKKSQSQESPEKTAEGVDINDESPTVDEETDDEPTEQESKKQEEQRSTIQNELIHQLITKKRRNKDKLISVSDDEEFYVDGHKPLRDILDLAMVLTDDPDIFKHHVLKERNFEAWIEKSLEKPSLADELRHIRSREDYITTLLAAE